MTKREREIIAIIKQNPLISQQEIADKLSLKRSSVAVHINNLMRKGIISGRAYLINDQPYVSVIGGANIDIAGHPFNVLQRADSNPGQVHISIGGVARNIAENLVKLETPTKLFTVLGDDFHGNRIIEDSIAAGIDMSHVKRTSEYQTGTYLAILNEKNDMDLAIAAMACFQALDEKYLLEHKQIIDNSEMIVLDTNLGERTLHSAVEIFDGSRLFLDTVSHKKAQRAKQIIGHFHTIKPNKVEAEALSGIAIHNRSDLLRSADYFHNLGVENVFITLGQAGVFYSDTDQQGTFRVSALTPKNATGAGDAFQAALVYAERKAMEIKQKVAFCVAASIVAMSAYSTINPEMSISKIHQVMSQWKEYENETDVAY